MGLNARCPALPCTEQYAFIVIKEEFTHHHRHLPTSFPFHHYLRLCLYKTAHRVRDTLHERQHHAVVRCA